MQLNVRFEVIHLTKVYNGSQHYEVSQEATLPLQAESGVRLHQHPIVLSVPRMTKQASRVRVGRGFPKQMTMTHVYEDVITLTSVGGIIQTYLFSANGMYDPNITATGHQPYYFDQMTALYNHYTVIGSKAEFEYVPTTVTEESCKLGASIQDDAGLTVTTPEQLDEFPQGTMKLCCSFYYGW